jgi:hypothetical protein
MTKKELQDSLKHAQIQSRAAWKVVGALAAIHNIGTEYRNEESFYNILVKKCLEEAKKEAESGN